MANKVSFKDLFAAPATLLEKSVLTEGELSFADETGYHIYGELRLCLSLSASTDTTNAKKFLEIIQAYAAITTACASVIGAEILEVQGERLHILLPGEASGRNVHSVLAFCSEWTRLLYEQVAPLAGKDWQGFASAVDQGRAILIKTGPQPNGSVVSLGSPANRPAKRLNRGITRAGYLSIPTELLDLVEAPKDRAAWQEVNMLEPPDYVKTGMSQSETNKLQEAATTSFERKALERLDVLYADKTVLKDILEKGVTTGLKVQGLYFRADLDGFTEEVREAFNDGENGIRELVERFVALMGYADQFSSKLDRQVIKLPWAGDCANMIILKMNTETFEIMKTDTAPLTAAEWHDQRKGFSIEERTWKELMGKAEWVVGIAGGDAEEGADGHLLVAPISAGRRTFLIAVGWGARRSLDAQSLDEAQPRDTIIPAVDYKALDSIYRKLFQPLTSIFYRASKLSKERVRAVAMSASEDNQEKVPQVNVIIPKPQPYYA